LQRCTRGVEFKLRYLTFPRSPLILVQWVMKNNTDAPLRFQPTIMLDFNLDDHLSGASFLTEWNGTQREIRKGMIPQAVNPSKNVVWLKPNDTQQDTKGISFMIAGDTARILSIFMGEILLIGAVDGMNYLMPHEERIITAGLLIDPDSHNTNLDLHEVLDKLLL